MEVPVSLTIKNVLLVECLLAFHLFGQVVEIPLTPVLTTNQTNVVKIGPDGQTWLYIPTGKTGLGMVYDGTTAVGAVQGFPQLKSVDPEKISERSWNRHR